VTYQFIWGDGDSNTSNSPVIHTRIRRAGDFPLTLTVRDDLGHSSNAQLVITVSSGLTVDLPRITGKPDQRARR
jgi:hypothetical protein